MWRRTQSMTVTLRREGREATEASKGDGPAMSAHRGRILRGPLRGRLRMTGGDVDNRIRASIAIRCGVLATGDNDAGLVGRAAHDAAELPRIRRRRRHSVHPRQLAARMEYGAGRAPAARDPRRRAEGRHPY